MDIEKVNLYLEKIFGRTVMSSFYKSIVSRMKINSSDTVLDFGCGTGNSARHIVKKAGKLVCLDIDGEKLKHAKRALKKYDNAEFVNRELTSCGYKDEFDKIAAVYVLHDFNVSMLTETAGSFYSSLKPNGKVYVCEPCKETHGIDPKLIKKHFADVGFKLVEKKLQENKFEMVFEKNNS